MDRFDQFYRDKMQERSVDFKPEYWEQAEAMLDKRKRHRRFVLWLWWGVGILLLLVVAWMGYGVWKPDGAQAEVQEEVQEQEQEESEQLAVGSRQEESEQLAVGSRQEQAVFEEDEGDNGDTRSTNQINGSAQGTDQKPDVVTDSISGKQFSRLQAYLDVFDPIDGLEAEVKYDGERTIAGEPEVSRSGKWSVFIVAGNTLYPYLNGSTDRLIGYHAGLQVKRDLPGPWSMYSGLNYRRRTGNFSFVQQSILASYRFGREELQYLTLPDRIHYLQLPLGVRYGWKRQQLSLGGRIAWLMGVQGSLNRTLDPELEPVTQLESGWLRKDGFKQFRIDLTLGYELYINPNLSIGLDLGYTPGTLLESNFQSPFDYYLRESRSFFVDIRFSYRLWEQR